MDLSLKMYLTYVPQLCNAVVMTKVHKSTCHAIGLPSGFQALKIDVIASAEQCQKHQANDVPESHLCLTQREDMLHHIHTFTPLTFLGFCSEGSNSTSSLMSAIVTTSAKG